MISPEFLHFFAAAFAVMFSSAGTAIGQGLASAGAIGTFTRQPLATDHTLRTLVIGLALIESGGILALVMSLVLLFTGSEPMTWAIGWAQVGMGVGLGVTACAVSVASSYAVKGACSSIARQPFFSPKIVTLMLVAQSMIEAPVIFAFIVSLLINSKITPAMTINEGLRLLTAGLVIGIGSIGPCIGQAFFSHASCAAIGINRKAYQKIFAFSLLSQAIIETPVIFCLLLACLLIFRPFAMAEPMFSLVSFFSSACALSLGSLGTGISTGYVASKSCTQMAENPESYGQVFRATILAQVFIESSVIYTLIVALFLVIRAT